ncbi:MAG: endonuclease MutS2 [Synechococcus sp. SB0673_bin_10]|nr:endonuclease MutS2 [Synechococcus sp. SB0675_bin_7]MYI72005.1 endonuclease MutS2 [Synechococcus sp. SB0673_bin_10]MYK07997.1 endonuclease MutS2 [Synechococcus sp. SB0670_bin_20]
MSEHSQYSRIRATTDLNCPNKPAQSLPAIQEEALELLGWPELCQHLAGFASTTMGRQALLRLSLPADLAWSQRLQQETRELLERDQQLEGGLDFRGVADLNPLVERCCKGGIATGEALLGVATTMAAVRKLRRQINDPHRLPVTTACLAQLHGLHQLERRLNHCLEEGGHVADRASSALAAVRRQLGEQRLELRQQLHMLLRRHQAVLQDTIISSRHGRAVVALKSGTLDQLPGLVHDSSTSGNTLFVEPQVLVPLGNRIRDLEAQERQEEEQVLRQLSQLVADDAQPLLNICAALLRLDTALARGRYGAAMGGVQPDFLETSLKADATEVAQEPILLRQLRHPLLVGQQQAGGANVVPVDIQVHPHQRVVAITGPNTGGKTVVLKSLGLALLMARAGLPVLCAGPARLPWADLVLADIGDEQSLQQNLSTFSGHIKRLARILAAVEASPTASINGVVLLDELGAGTDPSEGSALAIALLRHMADRVRLTMATTHCSALKALKYEDDRFENASVAFDEATMAPTYQLQWGIPGRSNALAIAQRLGLDPELLSQARALLKPQQAGEASSIISGLEQQRQQQNKAAAAAAALLARTEQLHAQVLSHWQRQQNEIARQQQQRQQQLEDSIQTAQQEVARIIRTLRHGTPDGEQARRAGQRLKALKQAQNGQSATAVDPSRRLPSPQGWSPHVGMRVRLQRLGKAAEVVNVKDDGRILELRCGPMRLQAHVDDVEFLNGDEARPAPSVQVTHRQSLAPGPEVRCAANTIDLRGFRLHEAESAVADQLSRCNGPIWVIHGIGTGRLKRGLQDWLKSTDQVERFHDAEPGDGGMGCTVVWPRR